MRVSEKNTQTRQQKSHKTQKTPRNPPRPNRKVAWQLEKHRGKQVKQKNEPSRKVAWQLEKTDHTPNKHKKAKVSASSDTAEVL